MKSLLLLLLLFTPSCLAQGDNGILSCNEENHQRHVVTCKKYKFKLIGIKSISICTVRCKKNIYAPVKSPIAICKNGKFNSNDILCQLNDGLVTRCDETNLEDCPYSIEEITEHIIKKLEGNEINLEEEQINALEKIPDPDIPEKQECLTSSDPDAPQLACAVNVPTLCKDRKTNYNYCARMVSSPSTYLFNCQDFFKRKALSQKVAMQKMKICYSCRVSGCTGYGYL